MVEISKADWKLFREKLPLWQERYIELLSGDKDASERFWALDKRIKNDRRAPGVTLSPRKSEMMWDIIRLVQDDVIILEDLSGFTETMQADIKEMLQHFNTP